MTESKMEIHEYLLVGVYADDEARWADSYKAETPAEAERMALTDYPGVTIAGVVELVNGKMEVVA